MQDFIASERQAQSGYFDIHHPDANGYKDTPYRLAPASRELNLAPTIREGATAYFTRNGIAWHQHANHALSSQICCLNFLMPLADRPKLLACAIERALGIDGAEMLPVEEGPSGEPWFVGFEWIGRQDHLNEAGSTGVRTRGANATSADAYVRFRHQGRTKGLLIEWKYTESYGAPIDWKGNAERERRYAKLAFAPAGPIRPDLGLSLTDFFYEPFYQLLRQQMLAFRMQNAREDGAVRVRVLHISPRANTALRKVTAPALQPFGDDAFAAFRAVLQQPDDFVSVSAEDVFGPLVAADDPEAAEWAAYLRERYTFLTDGLTRQQTGE